MAQSQIFARKAQVAVKAETTVDTLIAPVLADVFLAQNVSYTANGPNFSSDYVRADYLQMNETVGPADATLKFRIPIKGSGVDATAPEWGEALKACGFKETTTGSTSITYTAASTFDGSGGNPAQSYTTAALINGKRYPLIGSFGNVVFSGAIGNGEPGWMDFTFMGNYSAPTDSGLLVPVYDATIAPAFRGASMTFAGSTLKGVNAFTLDAGNKLTLGRDVNSATGTYGARIVNRHSTGSIDPEEVLAASIDHYLLWRNGTAAAFTTGAIGATPENIWTLACGKCIRRAPQQQDRDGIVALSIPFAVGGIPTDAEGTDIVLTLT